MLSVYPRLNRLRFRALLIPRHRYSSSQSGNATSVYAPRGCTLVEDRQSATRVAEQLRQVSRDRVFACDTEVNGFDTRFGPVGNGNVICLSIHGGDDLDFGAGPSIWIDTQLDMVTFRCLNSKRKFQLHQFIVVVVSNEGHT